MLMLSEPLRHLALERGPRPDEGGAGEPLKLGGLQAGGSALGPG
jgi:hypothetical protein